MAFIKIERARSVMTVRDLRRALALVTDPDLPIAIYDQDSGSSYSVSLNEAKIGRAFVDVVRHFESGATRSDSQIRDAFVLGVE